MSEQRRNFIRDYRLNGYSVSQLGERFSISRKTAHRWINRYEEFGASGFTELSRRPHRSPAQTPAEVREELVVMRTRQYLM